MTTKRKNVCFSKKYQHTQSQKSATGSSPVPAPQNEDEKNVKPYKFSPFQVAYQGNKMDYAMARLDDIMNFVRRVCYSKDFKFV
jgi:hypothetical protein